MKSFFSVFLAILAAAAVIYFFSERKAKLERWEVSKRLLVAEINSANQSFKEAAGDAELYGNSKTLSAANKAIGAINSMQQLNQQIATAEEQLLLLLNNKPGELDPSERKLLEDVSAERNSAEHRKATAQPAKRNEAQRIPVK